MITPLEAGVVALSALGSALVARRVPLVWVVVLFIWLGVQHLVAELVWGLTSDVVIARSLLLVKEGAIVGAFFVGVWLLATTREIWQVRPAFLILAASYLAFVTLYAAVIVQQQPLDQTLRGLRALAFPVALGVIGFALIRRNHDWQRAARALVIVGVAVAVAALIERIVVPVEAWVSVDLRGYWIEVKGLTPNTINAAGLPGNFFAYFAGPNVELRRAIGTLGDPLGLSYSLVVPFFIALCVGSGNSRVKPIWILGAYVIVAAIAASLSRLPLVIALSGVLGLLAWTLIHVRRGARSGHSIALAGSLVLALAGAVAFITLGLSDAASTPRLDMPDATASAPAATARPDEDYVDPSLLAHLDALLSTEWGRLVVGAGPGTHGILSSAYTSEGTEVSTNENVYVDIALQVGIVPSALFAALLGLGAWSSWRAGKQEGGSVGTQLVGFAIATALLAAAGMFSPQLLVVTSLGPFWLMLGASVRNARELGPVGPPAQRVRA